MDPLLTILQRLIDREVDFVLLRQKLAAGQSWLDSMHDQIQPKKK